jgi:hypothetical protein
MTEEQKNILIKDLCARLPYGVKCAIKNSDGYHHENIAKLGETTIDKLKGFDGKYFNIYHDDPLDWNWYVNEVGVEDIKPYLFPLSSMNEEQKEEHKDLLDNQYSFDANGNVFTLQDFYCKYHFDYRCLISMGLAIDATGLNIY